MAHSDAGRRRYGDSPKTPTTPTIEQLLQGDASWWPASTSPTTTSPRSSKDHDSEEDHTPRHKKSVLSKVKERAKKFRRSLSKKKHGQDGSNTTPSWVVSLGDDADYDDEDAEDPEYFGAPMYESEMAPEGYKEAARQHPRAISVVPEKHMLSTNVRHNINQGKHKKPVSPIMISEKHNIDQEKEKPLSPNKTLTETVTEKFAPAYATVSEATHVIASKIQGLAVSSPTEPAIGQHGCSGEQKSLTETVTEKLAPAYATVSEATHSIASKIQGLAAPSPTEQEIREHACMGKQKWDKGVSVKEYLVHKFEPGEDERALSHAIAEAMSPRKSSGDMGVVEKVKEAVSSLLRTEESVPSINTTTTTKSASHIPIYTNAHEVAAIKEENHGRILQAN